MLTGPSAELRERLLGELRALGTAEELLVWAKASLPLKNSLQEADAQAVEAAYRNKLDQGAASAEGQEQPKPAEAGQREAEGAVATVSVQVSQPEGGLAFPKERRKRSKAHLLFVRGRPCLICQRAPSDPHHVKFAQPRTLGRKVSDEFTVPLCRRHHQDLHRVGNERAWWANMQVDPLPIAKDLWAASPVHDAVRPLAPGGLPAPAASETSPQ